MPYLPSSISIRSYIRYNLAHSMTPLLIMSYRPWMSVFFILFSSKHVLNLRISNTFEPDNQPEGNSRFPTDLSIYDMDPMVVNIFPCFDLEIVLRHFVVSMSLRLWQLV